MAVGSLVSVEEYLNTSYRPDCDYVDGEVQERNLGERDHSATQTEIGFYLRGRYPQLRRRVLTEQRVQVKPTRFRIPDVCVITEDATNEKIIRTPPILCIEIFSPEDRWQSYYERLDDYFEMGVPTCWIIDPIRRCAWVATPGRLDVVADGILRCPEFEMPLAEVLE
jgi:Uma2 family endonuclease